MIQSLGLAAYCFQLPPAFVALDFADRWNALWFLHRDVVLFAGCDIANLNGRAVE
jgi:hypothetical protein